MEATKKDARIQTEADVRELFEQLFANANGQDTVKEVADLLGTYRPEVVRLFLHVTSQAQNVARRHRSNTSVARRKREQRQRAFS